MIAAGCDSGLHDAKPFADSLLTTRAGHPRAGSMMPRANRFLFHAFISQTHSGQTGLSLGVKMAAATENGSLDGSLISWVQVAGGFFLFFNSWLVATLSQAQGQNLALTHSVGVSSIPLECFKAIMKNRFLRSILLPQSHG